MSLARACLTLALALAVGWASPWRQTSLAPDLPVAAVVIVGALRPRDESLLLAALTGLAVDAFSAAAGTHAIVLTTIAYLAGRFGGRVYTGFLPVRAAFLLSGTVAADLLVPLVRHVLGQSDVAVSPGTVAARAAATALVGLLAWPGVRSGEASAS